MCNLTRPWCKTCLYLRSLPLSSQARSPSNFPSSNQSSPILLSCLCSSLIAPPCRPAKSSNLQSSLTKSPFCPIQAQPQQGSCELTANLNGKSVCHNSLRIGVSVMLTKIWHRASNHPPIKQIDRSYIHSEDFRLNKIQYFIFIMRNELSIKKCNNLFIIISITNFKSWIYCSSSEDFLLIL